MAGGGLCLLSWPVALAWLRYLGSPDLAELPRKVCDGWPQTKNEPRSKTTLGPGLKTKTTMMPMFGHSTPRGT